MVHLIPKEATLDCTPIAKLTNLFCNLLRMTNDHEIVDKVCDKSRFPSLVVATGFSQLSCNEYQFVSSILDIPAYSIDMAPQTMAEKAKAKLQAVLENPNRNDATCTCYHPPWPSS
jgi:hypothetical protein